VSDRRGLLSRCVYPVVTVLWIAIAVGEARRGHSRGALLFALIALAWVGASIVAFIRRRG
jgi:hypothetical protein